jgi:CRISPR-associated protein Cst2
MSKKITHIIGTFLISGKGAFLNSPGTVNDVTVPKTFYTLDEKGKQTRIPYVSSQAWKRWLRETFKEENPDEPQANIKVLQVDEKKHTPKKIGTDFNPILCIEDDIFGYMKTEKGSNKNKADESNEDRDEENDDETEEENDEQTDKAKNKKNSTVKPVIRTAPFQASILTSIRKIGGLTQDIGWVRPSGASEELMSKEIQFTTDSLGYKTEFFDTNLQGIFGLAYHRLGVFRNEGDRIELWEKWESQYLKEEKIKKVDGTANTFELTQNNRKERATKILNSLVNMRGGAKQTAFASPVHPQVIILAGLSCGNLIFNNLFKDTVDGPVIDINALKEIIKDYKKRIVTPVFIGIRTGYLNPESENALKNENWVNFDQEISVVVTTPIQAVEAFSKQLPETGLEIN